jgi:phage FluMu protein Com
MNEIRRAQIINALTSKGVSLACPRCNMENFTVIGEALLPMNFKANGSNGLSVPVVLIACTHCGHLTEHVHGVLGIGEE